MHVELMMGAFLLPFIAGFLMTAIPQFTASFECQKWELLWMACFLIGIATTGSFGLEGASLGLLFLAKIFLSIFCIRRYLSRKFEPPPFFVFVGLGLAMGLVGTLIQLILGPTVIGKLLATQGMVLSLILGIGSHLLPAIWGWSELPVRITPVGEGNSLRNGTLRVGLLALILLVSFALESQDSLRIAWLMRASLVTVLALTQWKIHRYPKERGKLVFWLWISAWFLGLGVWIPVGFPEYWVHGLHVAFIGGFGLMTFMIASRVTLVHGEYGHRPELRSKRLPVAAVLVLGAAVTRAIAIVIPSTYAHHLAYAAMLWVFGVFLWATEFVPKMLRLNTKLNLKA